MKTTILPHPFSQDSQFYSRLFTISLPITLQCFLSASLNLIDNIMVGRLGDSYIAGVGLANQFYFILHLILLGLGGGSSIFISQFWGSKNTESVKKILGLSLILGAVFSVAFFIVSFFAPQVILSIFSKDAEVIGIGSSFLKVVSFSFLLTAVSTCYAAALRSTGNASLPMIASIVGIIINTILNYTLIFGHFGAPALGVAGSAAATVTARLVEVLILLIVTYKNKDILAARFKELFVISSVLVKRFLATSGTLILKDMIWAIGVTAYMVVYARMSTEAAASVNIVQTIRQLAFVLFAGVSNACLIMVGNQIGSQSLDTAYLYAKRFIKITLFLGFSVGLFIVLARTLLLAPYGISDTVSETVILGASSILLIYGISLFIEVFNMICIVGVMRSGGDVTFCLVMDLIAVWLIGLPLAIIGGMVLKLPVQWVFALISLQEVFKLVLCYKRIVSKKWINNLVHDIS